MIISNFIRPECHRPEEKWMRFCWGELAYKPSGMRLSLHSWNEDHSTLIIGLVLLTLYIKLPPINREHSLDSGGYGFYFSEDALVFEWNRCNTFYYYPWSFSFYKRWELAKAYNYLLWIETPSRYPYDKLAHKSTAPYTYTLKNGEKQHRMATYHVTRMEWRRRWLMWLPLFNRKKTYLDVSFSEEVGEESGTWKGGVLGCSYEMIPGELPLQTLRRMERERKFN